MSHPASRIANSGATGDARVSSVSISESAGPASADPASNIRAADTESKFVVAEDIVSCVSLLSRFLVCLVFLLVLGSFGGQSYSWLLG
jgi:hypothetical protein